MTTFAINLREWDKLAGTRPRTIKSLPRRFRLNMALPTLDSSWTFRVRAAEIAEMSWHRDGELLYTRKISNSPRNHIQQRKLQFDRQVTFRRWAGANEGARRRDGNDKTCARSRRSSHKDEIHWLIIRFILTFGYFHVSHVNSAPSSSSTAIAIDHILWTLFSALGKYQTRTLWHSRRNKNSCFGFIVRIFYWANAERATNTRSASARSMMWTQKRYNWQPRSRPSATLDDDDDDERDFWWWRCLF